MTSIVFQSVHFPLQQGTLHPGKALPGIKGQKAAETGKPDSWSVMHSEKDLDQKGKMLKLINRNLNYNRVRRQEERALMPYETTEPNRKKKELLFLLGKSSANKKP